MTAPLIHRARTGFLGVVGGWSTCGLKDVKTSTVGRCVTCPRCRQIVAERRAAAKERNRTTQGATTP